VNEDATALKNLGEPEGTISVPRFVRILPDDPTIHPLPIIESNGRAWAVAWPDTGAHLRSLHRLSLDADGRSRSLGHPMEAVYYVMSGTAYIDSPSLNRVWTLPAGSMALVHPGTRYRFCGGPSGAEVVGGPCPADPGMYSGVATVRPPDGGGAIDLFHKDRPSLMMPMIAADARLIVWPGRGSQTANMNYVNMQPGERNVAHVHTGSEDTIYVMNGTGTIEDLTNGIDLMFEAPCAVHVPVGLWHAVRADRGSPIESVGGPAPADWNMMMRVGAYRLMAK
jgi:quercetin dioxygenase-like cupin family protein